MSDSVLPLDHFDSSVRPQDDLYRHVNGRWLATATIPDDRPVTGAFHLLRDASEETLGAILSDLAATTQPGGSEGEQLATLYRDFMDAAAVESLDATPLHAHLPRVDDIASVADLGHYLGWALRHGVGSLLAADVDADPGDPQRYVLFVAQSGLGLPDEEYYRLEAHAAIRAAYLDHVTRTLTLAGVPDPAGQAAAVLELETAIAARHWDKVRTRDLRQMYNLVSSEQFAADAPQLWPYVREGAGIGDDVAELVNCQPSFFADVADLLVDERLDAWRSWARFHLISALSPLLSSRFVDERFDFYERVLSGTPVLKERWKRAVALTERVLGDALGKQYVERTFSPTAKERMDQLVANLVAAYRESIERLDWMTDATRAEALEKLSRFRPKIGYPPKWRDYSHLRIVAGDLVCNALRGASFEFDHALSKLTGPMDPDEWHMFPQTVNAYYHPLRNEIVFPAAILQPPFFNEHADDAVNYGAIGAVIGHEIGHGFDDQGSRCDGDGRLRDWWTPDDRTAFEERTRALIDQYAVLEPDQAPGRRVNGELTIGENIGDLGGLAIAYKAWRIATRDQELMDLEGYTPEQRFFLSWAAVWATKARAELVLQRLATDPHSPPEFRCNQIVRNIDAFYQAFDVREGDAAWLAPAERVRIW